ncbi:MAG: protein phosphatase 2C domain-containing protein [Pseudomonadota bacterium]
MALAGHSVPAPRDATREGAAMGDELFEEITETPRSGKNGAEQAAPGVKRHRGELGKAMLSEALYRFETAVRTDVGCVRKLNEDSVLELPEAGLWVVADGMGGHTAGDFASQTIVAELETVGVPAGALDLKSRFLERLTTANTRIVRHAEELGSGAIGSTIAALLIQQDKYAAIWSGDSRVYRFRGGELVQITRDHTEVQSLLDSGQITQVEAENWPRKNVITRAIGVTERPECDMVQDSLMDADIFLICSDGLTEYFEAPELARLLSEIGHGPLEPLCHSLVETALERGGKDNTSVILLRCRRNKLPAFEVAQGYPEFGGEL